MVVSVTKLAVQLIEDALTRATVFSWKRNNSQEKDDPTNELSWKMKTTILEQIAASK